MKSTGEFRPEKLVIGILVSKPERLTELKDLLTGLYGPVDYEAGPLDFIYTSYYNNEMGTPIFRCFYAFRELIDPQRLSDIKIKTNEIERQFSEDGRRTINLDPGTLAQSRFVLATTKEGSHRIPLKGGIYGEVTLQFRSGTYREQEWTYPDFRSDTYKKILGEIREIYNNQLKDAGLRQPNYRKKLL